MHCTSIQRAPLHGRIRNLCHQHQWCTCPYRCGYRARWTHVFLCSGGRKGQSYLYRIRYVGNESTNLSPLDTTSKHAQARQTRKMLERFHGHSNPKVIQTAWPYLSSKDYHLRYAARIAIEWQDPLKWADKAYAETNDLAAIHALLGLARSDLKKTAWHQLLVGL